MCLIAAWAIEGGGFTCEANRLTFLAPASGRSRSLGLIAAACGGGRLGESERRRERTRPVNIAVNPWTGSAANAAVISYLLKEKLGYDVTLKDLKEGVDWQGFETGEVDAILEVWGHDADRKTFIDDKKVAQDAGQMGVNGTIGWYVPGWMAKEHPDITDWNNLNKYADAVQDLRVRRQGPIPAR